MLSTKRETQIIFYSKDLYETVKIPLRDKLLELTNSTELAILLNQIVYSKKDKLTLNQIKKLSLSEKTKQTLRTKLDKLVELDFLVKEKNTKLIFNQYLYVPTEKAFIDDMSIIALIEGKDLKNNPSYLRAAIINKFRSYALDGITEVQISANKLNSMLGSDYSESTVRNILRDLCREEYISANISYGVYNYTINLDKINNIINPEEANKLSNELIVIYKEYLNRLNIGYNKNQIDSYIMTFKRMILDGIDPAILKHVITFITMNYNDYKELLTPATIKKSFDSLRRLASKLSKRKASRFLYKLNNNLLNKEEINKEVIKPH